MFILSKSLGHPSLTAGTFTQSPQGRWAANSAMPPHPKHPSASSGDIPCSTAGCSESIRNVKPPSHKSKVPGFLSRSSAQLPRLHLSPPHLSPRIFFFFLDTLCYSEIEDSVNAELLSSNYNTQNTVSLWDWCCRRREHSSGTQS